MTETQQDRELKRIHERQDLRAETTMVPLAITKQVADAFSSGVDWQGSSKSMIFESMATTKSQGFSRNWEGFKAAMKKTAEVLKRHNSEIYREVNDVCRSVKEEAEKAAKKKEAEKAAKESPPEKMEMGKLPPADSRVFITDNWAGLYSKQVCVVPDATDEEILAACNAEDNAILPGSGKWDIVMRTPADAERAGTEFAAPGTCVECPPRIHMIVRSSRS
jgi:hypothetical protein